jgi:hypothetical protein
MGGDGARREGAAEALSARTSRSRYCRWMGFLDKAKKLAEQAQSKLDEVQKQVNTGGSSAPRPDGPVVEYDKHGRPIPQEQTSSPPHGDPLAAPAQGGWSAPAPPPAPPVASAPPATPGVPPTEPPSGPPAPVEGSIPPPAAPGVPAEPSAPPAAEAEDEDRNKPSYAPPKMTGGDPLAG